MEVLKRIGLGGKRISRMFNSETAIHNIQLLGSANIEKTPMNGETGQSSAAGEGQFSLAFTHAPIGMAIVGLDYRLRRVNRALCETLGYSQRELLEHNLMHITHPDDIGKAQELVGQLFRGEIPSYRLEKRFIAKDGREVRLFLTVLVIRDRQHNPLYGLAMIENITERKRAEEALRTSEERYRSFVVNSSEGIWRLESEQPVDTGLPVDEQVEIFYKYAYLAECNDAMARMYGMQRADDLIGLRLGELSFVPETTSRASIRTFIESGYRRHDIGSVVTNAAGEKRYFSSNIIGIVINGYLLRAWGTRRDESEQRLVEEELRHSRQQMRSLAAYLQSLREKERADIAREMHDVLGQALTGLKIDLSWLGKRLPRAESESVRAEMTAKLVETTHLLEETIAAVKNLSAELRPGVLDKFGLPAAVEWQCQKFAQRTGLSCKFKLPDDDERLEREPSTALFRILQEALTNVARHAKAKSVHVGLNITRERATLTVRDDGRGVTEEELSAPTSLGLLGMRERAEMLRGSLKVESGLSSGTIVTASIPFNDDEAH
jgi:PAS domain S-box-containing protein